VTPERQDAINWEIEQAKREAKKRHPTAVSINVYVRRRGGAETIVLTEVKGGAIYRDDLLLGDTYIWC